MCGIAGMFQRGGGDASLEIVKQLGMVMHHRGPDNFGFELRGKIAFAHNRLSLLDLSDAANQPFSNDRYSLIYNGEIYNFQENRTRLQKEFDVEFKTTSDTEVLFYSLILDGIEKCLKTTQGMFAFALYDEVEETLWLARDRMGIKPLYFYEADGAIYWASEIKAIARTLGLQPDPIRTLFAANNMAEKSAEYTLFKGVKSVGPGSYLRIKKEGEPKEVIYYDVVDDFDANYYNELDRKDTGQILQDFDRMFNDAVRKMLISDVPVGAFVSGGIDSSMISAVASEYNSDIKLFTANVVGKYSEFSDVQALSKHIGKDVYEYRFEPEMMLRDWADVTYHYDCPIVIHVNSIPFSNVAQLARDSNVKAVLTGEGADELFLGYPTLLTQRYDSLAAFPKNMVESLYKVYPKLHSYVFGQNGNTPIAFLNKVVSGFELQQLEQRADEKLNGLSKRERREQYMTIKMLREHLITLLHRNDRMGMMSSIEARFPFLDEEIVKFAVNLPSKFKIGRTPRFYNYKHPFLIDKWIVRKTAEKYLPDQIVRKKKQGFPMYGHKFLNIKDGFFRNGWVAESLGLSSTVQAYLQQTQDPYFVAKLASVEVFGRIYGMGHSNESVKQHIYDNAEVKGVSSAAR
ncbi:MAG: asparagine synthase (glutamine-hydrolyzing) [Pyrinomonadaceae bacterium]